MARRRHTAASRDGGAARLVRLLVLALFGAVGGMMLGELVVGTRTTRLTDEVPSFSALSANPEAAAIPQSEGAPACSGCPDSYGVAARLRALRDERMGDEFRELGTVDVEPLAAPNPEDDYRYGGRFLDPEPPEPAATTMTEDIWPAAPAGDAPPAGEPPQHSPAER